MGIADFGLLISLLGSPALDLASECVIDQSAVRNRQSSFVMLDSACYLNPRSFGN